MMGSDHGVSPALPAEAPPADTLAAWHAGERAMQEAAGSAAALGSAASRILKPYMTEQHRAFFPLLPFVVAGCVDRDLWPWATLLFGTPGFAWSPNSEQLRIDALPSAADPLSQVLADGAPLGLLGIELPTRRRNRLNGAVSLRDNDGFTVDVHQSFGNCPQYIQRRVVTGSLWRSSGPPVATAFGALDEATRDTLRGCDTFFVASYVQSPGGTLQVDVSHRGGRPGFVRVDPDGTLVIPDFPGNRYFNTLGNILVTRRAGMVVPVFETGDLLLLTGEAEVGLSPADHAEAVQVERAERLWRLRPMRGLWLRNAFVPALTLESWSPQSLASGVWPSATPSTSELHR